MAHASSPIAAGAPQWEGRVRRPWGALALGALYGLLWLVAELLILVTTLPLPVIVSARAVLLIPLPWLVTLHGARRSQSASAYPRVVLLALGVTLLGALPAVVFSTSHSTVGLGLLAALVLPPGLSLGAALAFAAALPRGDVPFAGRSAAATYAGCGFVLPLFGSALLTVVLFFVDAQIHFVKGTGNYGGLVVAFFFAMVMFLLFASFCGYVLTLIGGGIGRMLAARA